MTTRDNSKYIYAGCSLILLLLIALKPVGAYPDDRNYLDLLLFFRSDQLAEENTGRDYLYFYLAHIFSVMFGDKGAIISISLFTVTIKCWVIGKMSKYSLTALLTYVAFCVQLTDLTALRTSLSTSFLFLVIYFSSQKKYFKTFLHYILSCLSHIQGVILLPFLIFLNSIFYKYRYILFVSLFVFGALKLFPFGDFQSTGYAPLDLYLIALNNGLQEEINLFRLSTLSSLLLIFWLDYSNSLEGVFYKRLFLTALMSQLSIFAFYWFPVLAGRFADILLPFMIIYFSICLRKITLYQKIAILFVSFMINLNYLYVNPLFLRDGMLLK
ncbi:EpsG family protein [Pedobacter glucosidilyticus]|uniref:EpsG family protein n=1 Tax=Pedobacter glucosidilyticus TaxID=1122941 RepID=UPI001B7F81EB|nr:EpsG family protein [Pedobacter glucosidilyticus]